MTVSFEQIAKRAFEIWQQEGEVEGKEQEHWFRAEAELRKKQPKESTGKKSASSKNPAPSKASKSGAKMLKAGRSRL